MKRFDDFDMPTPKNLLLVDDLTGFLSTSFSLNEIDFVRKRIPSFRSCVSKSQNIEIVKIEDLIDSLWNKVSQKGHYDLMIGVSTAGFRIASNLSQRCSVTPKVIEVRIGHRFHGDFEIHWLRGEKDREKTLNLIESFKDSKTLICDDTSFSGETIQFLLNELNRKSELCDIGLANTLEETQKKLVDFGALHVFSGKVLIGRSFIDSNSLNLKDLFDPNALRVKNGENLPLMKIESWMKAWFAGDYNYLMKLCQEIDEVVRPAWKT